MSDEQKGWMALANKQTEMFKKITDTLYEHAPRELAEECVGNMFRLWDLVEYKATTSVEQIEKDYKFETEFLPTCNDWKERDSSKPFRCDKLTTCPRLAECMKTKEIRGTPQQIEDVIKAAMKKAALRIDVEYGAKDNAMCLNCQELVGDLCYALKARTPNKLTHVLDEVISCDYYKEMER